MPVYLQSTTAKYIVVQNQHNVHEKCGIERRSLSFDGNKKLYFVSFALERLLMDLQDILGKKVDVVTPAALHPKLRNRILGQAVDL